MQGIFSTVLEYLQRGWRVVPVEPGEKRCILPGWPDLVITAETVQRYFGRGQNIGVILGARSKDLGDADLDCPEALELADSYLPVTGAEFGRPAKPRSHRLYVAPGAIYAQHPDPITGQMLVELRADGRTGGAHQSLFPPSRHPSGEVASWVPEASVPRTVPATPLARVIAELAVACLVMRYLGRHAAARPGPDFPSLLWEFDHELGRVAYQWLGLADPEAPPPQLRSRRQFSPRELDLEEVVGAIPNNCGWEDWNKVGMAIWAASQGSAEGQLIFDDFSAKHSKYQPAAVAERWRNYAHTPPTRIGMGTLVHLARQAGWRPGRRGQ